jgi:rod shape-determining protein MreC
MRINGPGKRNRRITANAYVFMALVIVSFSVLLVSTRSFVIVFKDLGFSIFSGIRGGVYGFSSFFSRTVLSIRELAALRQEYAELSDRMTRYEQLERTSSEIRQENRRLREQLGFSETLRYRYIPAEFIGRDPDNLFSALVINKGKYHGLKNGMPVVAFQGGIQALVGKVIQTGQFESLVMPLYDASSYVSSRFSESRYEGIVEGQGRPDLPLIMRFIQKLAREEIGFGDLVSSSGLGGVFPPGITIGRVSGITYQESETSMEVKLTAAIDFYRLEYMFVIEVEKDSREPPEREGDG